VTPGPVLAQSRVKTCLKTINYQSAHMSTRFEARSAGSIAICELFLAFSFDFCSDVDQTNVLCDPWASVDPNQSGYMSKNHKLPICTHEHEF
jgi:hypothetical protein